MTAATRRDTKAIIARAVKRLGTEEGQQELRRIQEDVERFSEEMRQATKVEWWQLKEPMTI